MRPRNEASKLSLLRLACDATHFSTPPADVFWGGGSAGGGDDGGTGGAAARMHSPFTAICPGGQKQVLLLRQAAGAERGSGQEMFATPPDRMQTRSVDGSADGPSVPVSGLPLTSRTARFGKFFTIELAVAPERVLFCTSLFACV